MLEWGDGMLQINEAFYHLQGKDMFVQKNHSHNEIELIQVVNGNGMVLKNDRSYPLQSQHIYVIDARNAHIVYPQPEDCKDYIRNKIVIDADSFVAFCKEIGIYDTVAELFDAAPVATADYPYIDGLYQIICSAVNSKGPAEYGFAQGYIIELLHWIHSHKDLGGQYLQNTTVQKIVDFVSHKNGITSLQEISTALYLNKFYICHIFKDKTGQNLSDYICEKKYEQAVKLLLGSAYTIDEIAGKCGYSATSSFIRFFKSKSGLSPSLFRKKKRSMEK